MIDKIYEKNICETNIQLNPLEYNQDIDIILLTVSEGFDKSVRDQISYFGRIKSFILTSDITSVLYIGNNLLIG